MMLPLKSIVVLRSRITRFGGRPFSCCKEKDSVIDFPKKKKKKRMAMPEMPFMHLLQLAHLYSAYESRLSTFIDSLLSNIILPKQFQALFSWSSFPYWQGWLENKR